ncbi:MAG: CPBP family intramembrane metalloprotease [Salinivirgaceae bacterium]|nr:CPBP family intramembrane metalloprotease [Salinivirgaceae bacterium]
MTEKTYKEFTVGSALLAMLIVCGTAMLSAVVQIMLKYVPISTSWSMLIAYVVQFAAGLAIIKIIWRGICFKFNKFNAKQTLIAIATILAMGVVCEAAMILFPMPDKLAALFNVVLQPNIATFLCVCIAAPMLEEMVFRGAILGGMLNSGIAARKAIIVSAALFALMHLNPWQGVPAFAIGLLFGWIYKQTQSLWPSMILHFANNTTSYCISTIYGDSNVTVKDLVGSTQIYIVVVIVCIAITYLGIKWLSKLFANNKAV